MLAITQGDGAGIGPELALQLLAQPEQTDCHLFGSLSLLQEVSKKLSLPLDPSRITDIPFKGEIRPGVISATAGAHSFACLQAAVEETRAGKFRAVVTNPIHKEAWALASLPYPGHTEYLAEVSSRNRHAMMLTSDEITCSLVTTHLALADVPAALTRERLLSVIELTAETMARLRQRPARLTMPGLNPHAGEGGLFGREELDLLIPVLEEARSRGIDIVGPISPDTAFLPKIRQATDAYVCCYHDQGLIPLKTLAFEEGVNVTLGLDFIRTSVDHGTAFDLAWKGQASLISLLEATRVARLLAA